MHCRLKLGKTKFLEVNYKDLVQGHCPKKATSESGISKQFWREDQISIKIYKWKPERKIPNAMWLLLKSSSIMEIIQLDNTAKKTLERINFFVFQVLSKGKWPDQAKPQRG